MRPINQKPRAHHTPPRTQQGITLIELMIGLVIGLLATGAMLKVYVDSSRLYRFNEGLARIQENGRFATEFIRRDARMAGFWGCNSAVDPANQISPDSASYIAFEAGDVTGTNGLEHSEPDKLDEPDSITFTRAAGGTLVTNNDMVSASSVVPVDSLGDFDTGDVLIISDCETADIFQLTAIGGSAPNLTLEHDTDADTNSSAELSKAYSSESRIYTVTQTAFCIAPGADPLQPALRQFNPAFQACAGGEELVEGIENMQILMGEDTDADSEGSGGDGTANRYVPPDTSDLDIDRVVSIRISLLARSLNNNLTTEPSPYFFNGATVTPSADDKYLRKVFTTTITLRNKTG